MFSSSSFKASVCVLLLSCLASTMVSGQFINYTNNGTDWGGMCNDASNNFQSPIELPTIDDITISSNANWL
jgi:hypothetical protein